MNLWDTLRCWISDDCGEEDWDPERDETVLFLRAARRQADAATERVRRGEPTRDEALGNLWGAPPWRDRGRPT